MRKRLQKGAGAHYLIAANKQAGEYSERAVRRLTGAIRDQGGYYTIIEPSSYDDLVTTAREHCRLIPPSRPFPPPVLKRGAVSSLVAAGGDGTVNAVARVALEGNLPMGILPLGHLNNIAKSLCNHADQKAAIDAIISRQYRPIDTIRLGDRVVIGSISFGLLPKLHAQLDGKKPPRFAFRWTSLVSKVAASVEPVRFIAKVDVFRFEIASKFVSINLLAYTLGLPLSPPSIPDDGEAELIFEVNCSDRDLGQYIRDLYKGKYMYGSTVRLFRGANFHFNPGRRHTVLLDGDLVDLPDQDYTIQVGALKLNLFC